MKTVITVEIEFVPSSISSQKIKMFFIRYE